MCELLRRERPFRFPFDAMMRFAMVIDAVVHEDDIRSALGLEPAPGGDAQALAITVNVTHYDAFRMLSGR